MHAPTVRYPLLAAGALLALASLPLQAGCLPPLDENSLARLPGPLLAEPDEAPAGAFRVLDAQGRTHRVSGMQIDYGTYASGFLSAFGTHRAAPLRSGFLVRDGNGFMRIDWARVERVTVSMQPAWLLREEADGPVTCVEDRRSWQKAGEHAAWHGSAQRLVAEVTWRDGRHVSYELVSDSVAGISGMRDDGSFAIRLAEVREIAPPM